MAWLAAVLLVLVAWLLRRPAFAVVRHALSGALLCLPAGALALLAVILNAPAYVALALIVFPKVHRYLEQPDHGDGAHAAHVDRKSEGDSPRRGFCCGMCFPVIKREVAGPGRRLDRPGHQRCHSGGGALRNPRHRTTGMAVGAGAGPAAADQHFHAGDRLRDAGQLGQRPAGGGAEATVMRALRQRRQ